MLPDNMISGKYKSRKELVEKLPMSMSIDWTRFGRLYNLVPMDFDAYTELRDLYVSAVSDVQKRPNKAKVPPPWIAEMRSKLRDKPDSHPYSYAPFVKMSYKIFSVEDDYGSHGIGATVLNIEGSYYIYFDIIDSRWYTEKEYLEVYTSLERFKTKHGIQLPMYT